MNKLRRFSLAFACAALITTAWAADDSQPQGAGTSGQSSELQQLKAQLEQQQKQIEQLRTTLEAQQKLLEKTENAPPAEAAQPVIEHTAPNLGDVASTTPIIPQGVAPSAGAAQPPKPQQPISVGENPLSKSAEAVSTTPLTIHIGDTASITPVGFMDLTNTFRSTNSGANLATNFGSIPYNNTVGGRLTEDKFSATNSRIGFRVDAVYKDYHVLGYFEGDFVGGVANAAFNTQVTSNSQLFRIRLYWVDLRKDKFEFLAGQSWSLMTPNRNGMSALPGDLFYGQEFDVNYLNGLTWGRIPGLRFLYHPSKAVTLGISAENSSQYFGGSGGGGVPTLPAALTTLTSNELDANVANGYSLPNVIPDIIAKIAFQPNARVHFEIAGVTDRAKVFNFNTIPALGAQQYFTKQGGGGSVNANFEVVKNFRLVTNNFWSDGAGRYLFGVAPDFIVRANGAISLLHSGSTLDGFETRVGKTQIYGYYGGIYIGRDVAYDANGTSLIGYGYTKSANSQNRTTQEGTIGITQTFFSDPKYGSVAMYLDYAYFFRNPWYVATGAPKNAHENAVWFDLRYTLPGSAPIISY
jgi:TolA-binding protein